MSDISRAATDFSRSIFGGGGEMGFLGTGQYQSDPTMINQNTADQAALTKLLWERVNGQRSSPSDIEARNLSNRLASQAQGAMGAVSSSVSPDLALKNLTRQREGLQRSLNEKVLAGRAQEELAALSNLATQQNQIFSQEVKKETTQAEAYQQAAQNRQQLVKAGAEAGGKILASDERKKKAISKEKGDSSGEKSFLDALSAYSFNYKDEKNGKGRQLGIMAQDLEKMGPVGKQMVENTPEGKKVNFAKGIGALLAISSQLNEKLDRLETSSPKKETKKGEGR